MNTVNKMNIADKPTDKQKCMHFWKFNHCKFGEGCRFEHIINPNPTDNQSHHQQRHQQHRHQQDSSRHTIQKHQSDVRPPRRPNRPKNTECFEPMTRPVDLRIVCDIGNHIETCTTNLTSRDVLLVPNLFSDFKTGEIYDMLLKEINECGIPKDRLLKMWHGNDKIEGTHLIADDKTKWKETCPTFHMVLDRIRNFFNMNIQATRFNLYTDRLQWKPFHHDAAAVNPEKAEVQNFTVAVSFGATRDAAFEHAKTKTVISSPQPDGWVYTFSKDTNVIWRHGILQGDDSVGEHGRISVIAWGWVDNMKSLN